MNEFGRLLIDDSGSTMAQYAVITAVLSVAMIGALATIAAECSTQLGSTSNGLTALETSPP